jgi:superfamily II DNA or RNA helicase
MKILVGNLISKIETDNPGLLKALVNLFAFPVPGHEYVQAFKQRHWDGKKYFINKNGNFRTGLLDRVLDELKRIKCTPEIVYDFTYTPGTQDPTIKDFDFYDYQKKVIDTALEKRRCLVNSPTGSGKTLIMAGLLKALAPRKTLILFDEKGILNQTYKFLTKNCKFTNVGANSGDGLVKGQIMLSTYQSLEKIFDDYRDSEVLMVDEVHKFCKGEVTTAAINSFPAAVYRYGFTATLPDKPIYLYELEGAFGGIQTTRTTQELIEDQKLSKPIIQILNYAPSGDFSDLSYQELYDEHIIQSEERNNMIVSIVSLAQMRSTQGRIIILVKNLEHLNNLKRLLPDAFTIEGVNDTGERYEAIKKFLKSKKTSILIGTSVLQTGINIEEITHVINARGLKDKIPTIQGLGRGLRRADGKNHVYYYDFFDHVPYLDDHSKARIKHYKDEGHEIKRL